MQASLGKLRRLSDFHLQTGELVLGGWEVGEVAIIAEISTNVNNC